jgi:hypothetical protein
MPQGVANPRAGASNAPRAGRNKRNSSPAANRLEALRWLRLAIVLAALLPLGFFAAAAYSDYQSAYHQAQTRTQRAAQIAQEHVNRVLEINEVIARQVLHNLGAGSDAQIRAQEAQIHGQLKNLADGLSHIQNITIWNADGKPLASSRGLPASPILDVSDREYFKFHRTHRDAWFISEVLIGRISGTAFIDVSTRRELPGGGFGGVVSTTVLPAYFTDFYRTL